ncbi:MAG: 50S ribosomal protein L23 [Gammaproteobacteria bacterium]|nr:50S ribosomal protein L23 [Gammaproteobacteria bacterium]
MNKAELFKIILSPVVSEKSYRLGDKQNQVLFKVLKCATKFDIKKAVEMLFDVKVDSVCTLNMKGKKRKFGKTTGVTKEWKKAYVRLSEGHSINFAGTE